MIFITVGTQLKFPRLMEWVSIAAQKTGKQFVAQTADYSFESKFLVHEPFLSASTMNDYMQKADLVIGHTGIGTILSAMRHEKILITVPRAFALGEHRNDHQMATAGKMEGRTGCYVVYDLEKFMQLMYAGNLQRMQNTSNSSSSKLISSVQSQAIQLVS